MLDPASSVAKGDPLIEKSLGTATGAGDAVWTSDQTPMLLHVFEFITRSALLAWMSEPNRPVRS